LRRKIRVDNQHIRRTTYHADGGEIFHGVVLQLTRSRAGAVGGDIALNQRVAVGCGACSILAANGTNAPSLCDLVRPRRPQQRRARCSGWFCWGMPPVQRLNVAKGLSP
jgi:hypothetical protein